MYSVYQSSLVEARTTMDNILLSHSYIFMFPPKSLFSKTLILICITLSLVTLLGNHFSFHFIAREMSHQYYLSFCSQLQHYTQSCYPYGYITSSLSSLSLYFLSLLCFYFILCFIFLPFLSFDIFILVTHLFLCVLFPFRRFQSSLTGYRPLSLCVTEDTAISLSSCSFLQLPFPCHSPYKIAVS